MDELLRRVDATTLVDQSSWGLGAAPHPPGQIHFKVSHPAGRAETIQIYFEGDPFIDSDVVGAVKDSLVIALVSNGEAETRCCYDFVLTASDNL